MSNSRRIAHGVITVLACLGLYGLPAPAEAQRSDRAAISGVVTDNQGAAVPGASVTVRNEATGVEVVLTTNEAGAYSSPPLVLGRYSVTVDLTGFKKMVSTGILLQGGDAIRQDVALQVGDLTESVEVRGTPIPAYGDIPMQRFIRFAAGGSVSTQLAPNDVSYEIGEDRCFPCKRIRVTVPTAGTLHLTATQPAVAATGLNIWVNSTRFSPAASSVRADAPVSAGEIFVYVGGFSSTSGYVPFTFATSLTSPGTGELPTSNFQLPTSKSQIPNPKSQLRTTQLAN